MSLRERIAHVIELFHELWGTVDPARIRDRLCEAAACLLEALEEGARLGTRLFNAIWRLTPMVAIEGPVFRVVGGKDCVWLARRGDSESYPDQLHCPGTIARASDRTIGDAIERLATNEYRLPGGLVLFQPDPVRVRYVQEERGMMFSNLYVVTLTGDPSSDRGRWVPIDKLLDHVIVQEHLHHLIPDAHAEWVKLGRP